MPENTETGIDVEKRWREWINFEASVIENYGKNETIQNVVFSLWLSI
jgi:hypothetical protein